MLNGADDVNSDGADWTTDPDNASDVGNEILFCGYRFDPESHLYHVRRRMYHPTLGRWLQRDPLGYVDGMGLYEYCASLPIRAFDPLGLADLIRRHYGPPLSSDPTEQRVTYGNGREAAVGSTVSVIEKDGRQAVRVTTTEGPAHEKLRASNALVENMRGQPTKEHPTTDYDSGQVLVIARDANGNVIRTGRETNALSPRTERRKGAVWKAGPDGNSAYQDFPIPFNAHSVSVREVYTDVAPGQEDVSAVIGSWEMQRKEDGRWGGPERNDADIGREGYKEVKGVIESASDRTGKGGDPLYTLEPRKGEGLLDTGYDIQPKTRR